MEPSRFTNTQWYIEQWQRYNRLLPTAFLFGILCFLIYFVTLAAPLDFPTATYLKISPGETSAQVAQDLAERQIIQSAPIFTHILALYKKQGEPAPGEYFFPGPEGVIVVAKRIARGDFELTPVRVTIPEGANSHEMGDLLAQKLPDFDEPAFLRDAQPKEGYLFPDTYFFLPGQNPDTVLTMLSNNFANHVAQAQVVQAITTFGKPLPDVVTMASLLEKEAPKTADRKIIAGILWRRIAIGMPLQVDAVFPYIMGKNSFQLTRADLRTPSPYNTYVNKGLPVGPITNPGLDAILDAVTPTKTPYLYYLSDMHGNMHYSKTYAEQLANQKKYLSN